MISKSITIVNKLGLHARAAAKLVSTASAFKSAVELEKGSQRINAKSIMGVMMLAASQGTELTLYVDGDDAAETAASIEKLIEDKFGEDE